MCAQKEAGRTKVDELIERLDQLTSAVERLAEITNLNLKAMSELRGMSSQEPPPPAP
jgi:hypothetical protein